MVRNVLSLTLAQLVLVPAAHAGLGAVYVDHATASVQIDVHNVSASTDLAQRELQVTSADPMVHVDGDFGCPVGSTADGLELMFGTVAVHWVSPPQLITLGVWDVSPELDLQGQPFGSFEIDAPMDVPTTWDPEQLITWGFNPVAIVESHLDTAADNNADLVAWMRSDQVFEATVTLNAVVWCDNGQALIPGLESRDLDVSIFFHGDPRIQYQAVAGSPTDVTSGTSGTPGYATGTGGTGTGGTGTSGTGTSGTATTTPPKR